MGGCIASYLADCWLQSGGLDAAAGGGSERYANGGVIECVHASAAVRRYAIWYLFKVDVSNLLAML